MEIIVTFEEFRFQVLGNQLQGGSHVVGEGPLRICSRDEAHGAARTFRAGQQGRLHSGLLQAAPVEMPEFVIPDLPDEAGRHAENRCAGDGVGGGTSWDILYPDLLQLVPDPVSCFKVDMLHAAGREVVFSKHRFIREHSQDVSEGIANS